MEAALLRRKTEHGQFRDRVKHQLAMAIVDAFRRPCRARCIERRRLDVLVEVGEIKVRRCSREQLLIFAGELELAGHRRFAVGENDQPFDLR